MSKPTFYIICQEAIGIEFGYKVVEAVTFFTMPAVNGLLYLSLNCSHYKSVLLKHYTTNKHMNDLFQHKRQYTCKV